MPMEENEIISVDPETLSGTPREAVGFTIFNFPVLAQPTEMGPRSVPLTGLAELSPEMRGLALSILRRSPVSDHLKLSAYAPSSNRPNWCRLRSSSRLRLHPPRKRVD